jgi:hypothetical protein
MRKLSQRSSLPKDTQLLSGRARHKPRSSHSGCGHHVLPVSFCPSVLGFASARFKILTRLQNNSLATLGRVEGGSQDVEIVVEGILT